MSSIESVFQITVTWQYQIAAKRLVSIDGGAWAAAISPLKSLWRPFSATHTSPKYPNEIS